MSATEAVIHIKGLLNTVNEVAADLTCLLNVPLQGINGTARAAHSAKRQDLPFVDLWLLSPLHLPPDET